MASKSLEYYLWLAEWQKGLTTKHLHTQLYPFASELMIRLLSTSEIMYASQIVQIHALYIY